MSWKRSAFSDQRSVIGYGTMSVSHLPTFISHPAKFAPRVRAFTLIEMLTVLAIIGIMIGAIGYLFRTGGSSTVGLQAAQSQLAALLTLARTKAAISGRTTALFINKNPRNSERYLRYLVPVIANDGSSPSDTRAWVEVSDGVFLPQGCFAVPKNGPGLAIESGADWSGLLSTGLNISANQVLNAKLTDDPEDWIGVGFTPRGTKTVLTGTDVILATGRPVAPGIDPPFVFTNPDNVRGLSISSYGQVTLIDNRAGF